MGSLREKLNHFRFKGTLAIVLVFALIAAILLVELSGVQVQYNQKTLEMLNSEYRFGSNMAPKNLKKTRNINTF